VYLLRINPQAVQLREDEDDDAGELYYLDSPYSSGNLSSLKLRINDIPRPVVHVEIIQ
jgi:hypothetical protein